MRKLLQLTLFALLLTGVTQAQVCTPGQIYIFLGLPGVFPNPLIQDSLTPGTQGIAYTETFTIIVPQDTVIDLSAQVGLPIPPISVSVNYQSVTAFNGLPNGLNTTCDIASCQWPGGTNGCIRLAGTPTQGGNFNVAMTTSWNISVPAQVPVIGGTAIDIPIPGLNWSLNIAGTNAIDPQATGLWIAQNAPNPFHGTTTISYHNSKPGQVSLTVTDLAGKRLHAETFRAQVGENEFTYDASNLAPGIYLYQISNGENSAMSKMIVQ